MASQPDLDTPKVELENDDESCANYGPVKPANDHAMPANNLASDPVPEFCDCAYFAHMHA